MNGDDGAISRMLVVGAEAQTRQDVVSNLLQLCGQETTLDTSQGAHDLALKTKYYTADLEVHVHAVEANELQTPLVYDADQYEALLWVVDAASESSFLGTEQFVGNSIEELDFNVSLVIGTHAASASLVQLKRLEQWAQNNGFEFVAVDEEKNGKHDDPLHEKRGMDRVKEALECNMWASLKMLEKPALGAGANVTASALSNQSAVAVKVEEGDDEETALPSKILVLGADLPEQHDVVKALTNLTGDDKISTTGEAVQELKLKTKYYEADVELHLHRIDMNELVTGLQHDVETYEALLWVVDASSDRSFKEVQQFVERSIEELTFEISLIVGTHVDQASSTQVEALESWCQKNEFEFVGVVTKSSTADPASGAVEEKEGIDRVLEALHCNMWRSMKMLPRVAESKPEQPVAPDVPAPSINDLPTPAVHGGTSSPPAAPTSTSELMSDDARFQASLAALSGAGFASDEDPDMKAFSGLLSQVQRIRENGAVLSDDERRRQAERVAMQLWNLLGADDDDESGQESD